MGTFALITGAEDEVQNQTLVLKEVLNKQRDNQ